MKPIPYLLVVSGPLAILAAGSAIRWDLGWLGGMGLFYAGLALAELGYLLWAITRADMPAKAESGDSALMSPEV